MRKNIYITLAALLVTAGAVAIVPLRAQQQKSEPEKSMPACPMMKKHAHDEMNSRGEHGMGFSQEKTTHHFYLRQNGGVIQVEAKDAKDTASMDQIRGHLRHITMMFAEGNFDIPMFVHDQVPPGVPDMQRLRSRITYQYEDTKHGGRVIISSADSEAVVAIQSFLRFQITEHRTGDPLGVN